MEVTESKTQKALGFFKDIPGWARGIIIIIVVLFIVWLVYKFYKKMTPSAMDLNIVKDKDLLVGQGQKPSFVRSWYDASADKLYACGAGQTTFTGTDEQCIYSVFVQLKNDLDVVLLTEAFGMRRKGFSFNEANLGGWITDELNSEERSALNNILARRQIKYRF